LTVAWTASVADKITRDAFLFLRPKLPKLAEDFAQCGPCRMFVPEEALGGELKGDRCIIHGAFVAIDEDDSCGFMVGWPTEDGSPNPEVVKDHAAELKKQIPGSVTPEDSGLVSRRVQCHRCEFAENNVTRCGLFAKLNQAMPDIFNLNTEIEQHSCCNAQETRTKRASPRPEKLTPEATEYAAKEIGQRLDRAKR
jgi:hypothetical protein